MERNIGKNNREQRERRTRLDTLCQVIDQYYSLNEKDGGFLLFAEEMQIKPDIGKRIQYAVDEPNKRMYQAAFLEKFQDRYTPLQ